MVQWSNLTMLPLFSLAVLSHLFRIRAFQPLLPPILVRQFNRLHENTQHVQRDIPAPVHHFHTHEASVPIVSRVVMWDTPLDSPELEVPSMQKVNLTTVSGKPECIKNVSGIESFGCEIPILQSQTTTTTNHYRVPHPNTNAFETTREARRRRRQQSTPTMASSFLRVAAAKAPSALSKLLPQGSTGRKEQSYSASQHDASGRQMERPKGRRLKNWCSVSKDKTLGNVHSRKQHTSESSTRTSNSVQTPGFDAEVKDVTIDPIDIPIAKEERHTQFVEVESVPPEVWPTKQFQNLAILSNKTAPLPTTFPGINIRTSNTNNVSSGLGRISRAFNPRDQYNVKRSRSNRRQWNEGKPHEVHPFTPERDPVDKFTELLGNKLENLIWGGTTPDRGANIVRSNPVYYSRSEEDNVEEKFRQWRRMHIDNQLHEYWSRQKRNAATQGEESRGVTPTASVNKGKGDANAWSVGMSRLSSVLGVFKNGNPKQRQGATEMRPRREPGALLPFFALCWRYFSQVIAIIGRWASVQDTIPQPVVATIVGMVGIWSKPKFRVQFVSLSLFGIRTLGELLHQTMDECPGDTASGYWPEDHGS